MTSLPVPLRAVLLSTLLAVSQAASLPSIFERQATCAAAGFTACANGLPNNFCCKAGQTCITLAGGTTVLCCPESKCDRIQPITCNLSFQDPTAHPDAPIKTTALRGKLPTCGTLCCPFGYACNDLGQCVLGQDQSVKPIEAPASQLPSSTPGPSSTIPAPTIVPTTAPSEAPTAAPPAEQQTGETGAGSAFPTTAVVVGVLCGVLGGIAVTVAILIWLARRKKRRATQPHKKGHGLCRASTSTSSFGHTISDPIPHMDSTLRTDFILKTPSTISSSKSPTAVLPARTPSSRSAIPQHSPAGTTATNPRTPERGQVFGAPVRPIRTMRPNPSPWVRQQPPPVTPRLQREPSGESINVFVDPRTVRAANDKRLTSATTFTDLMDQADLGDVRRGQPFVPAGSVQNTPRTPAAAARR